MTRCLARRLLVLLTVAWSLTSIVNAEPAKPNKSASRRSQSGAEPATPQATEPAKPSGCRNPQMPKPPKRRSPKAAETDAGEGRRCGDGAKIVAGASTSSSNTYTVKKSPLRITLELDGVFESRKTHEVLVKPEEWTRLTVLEAVPMARVKEGDVLLKLDTKKLDQAISDLQTEQKLGELARQLASDQLRALEKARAHGHGGQRTDAHALPRRIAADYFDVERPLLLKATEHRLKDAKDAVEYQAEELRQLEKMYKADDITEETEQIVLKRARDNARTREVLGRDGTTRHDEMLKYHDSAMDTQIKEYARRKAIDWEKDKAQLPLALQKQRLEVEKLRIAARLGRRRGSRTVGRSGIDGGQVADRRGGVLRQGGRAGSSAIPTAWPKCFAATATSRRTKW